MGDDFHHLVTRFLNDDRIAFKEILFVSTTIIKTWAKHEKQELRWIAYSGKSIEFDHLVVSVMEKYSKEQFNINQDCNSFELFKDYIIKEFKEKLLICFSEFMNLLNSNNEQAWQIVFSDLENKASAWFYKRSPSVNGECHSIFCESVEVVYSKLMKRELNFSDSSSFKSYFFKTLENKFFESIKKTYRRRTFSFESLNISAVIQPEVDYIIEEHENKRVLNNALLKLDYDERKILTDYYFGKKKLREIACQTSQTEENVRIKKYRALKKLSDHFKSIGYEP
jgi:RNA polymerase sigma-70 factor (ECF subfamily)